MNRPGRWCSQRERLPLLFVRRCLPAVHQARPEVRGADIGPSSISRPILFLFSLATPWRRDRIHEGRPPWRLHPALASLGERARKAAKTDLTDERRDGRSLWLASKTLFPKG